MKKYILLLSLLFLLFNSNVGKAHAQAVTYNIHGRVFNDLNQNGIQDSGEEGVSGIFVGIKYTSYYAYSDMYGFYNITNVPATSQSSTYQLVMIPPEGYIETISASDNLALNSNLNKDYGIVAIPVDVLTSIRGGSNSLRGIICPDNKGILCIAVGNDTQTGGKILTTTDGANWEIATTIPSFYGYGIVCPNSGEIFCIAVGASSFDHAMILTTTDGISWIKANGLPDVNKRLLRIACPNQNGILCIAVGDGIILTTTNGASWTEINVTPPVLYDIACPNKNGILCIAVGLIAGSGKQVAISTTTDGFNWTAVQNLPQYYAGNGLQGISCSKNGNFFVWQLVMD